MGGAAPIPSAGGRRKLVDAAINLVPFIDLLSCCISFLLITAVWTQLSKIEVSSRGSADGAIIEREPPPTTTFTLYVASDGYTLARSTGEHQLIPRASGAFDAEKLALALQKIKQEFPDRFDLNISAEDATSYQDLLKTMDVAIGAKFPDIRLDWAGRG